MPDTQESHTGPAKLEQIVLVAAALSHTMKAGTFTKFTLLPQRVIDGMVWLYIDYSHRYRTWKKKLKGGYTFKDMIDQNEVLKCQPDDKGNFLHQMFQMSGAHVQQFLLLGFASTEITEIWHIITTESLCVCSTKYICFNKSFVFVYY